jgi:hypothetical protein
LWGCCLLSPDRLALCFLTSATPRHPVN